MTNLEIQNAYIGNTDVEKIYLGNTVVYEPSSPTPVYSAMPLTFEIISGGTLYWKAQYTSYTTTIEYSRDNGSTWTSITSNTGESAPSISVDAGDIIQFRGYNDSYSSGNSRYNNFSGSSVYFKAYGNIMSLFDGDSFVSLVSFPEGSTHNLRRFFQNANVVDAENLVLPATALTSYCYSGMFNGCGSLTAAPALPATILANSCYYYMFENCTNLTAAPELPTTTLANSCYTGMFKGCTNLIYIKCLATDISATNCTLSWVDGVASSGTFVKNPYMSDWRIGLNGIPDNWTVQDADIPYM